MGARVVIEWQGLGSVISSLAAIEEKAPRSLERQVAALAKDTEKEWRQVTPRRTGRLQNADQAEVSGLSFTLKNNIFYYRFLDEGHDTPRGWRTKHGYRLAKRRSHVAGRDMTAKMVQFIEQNIKSYLSKFLDNM